MATPDGQFDVEYEFGPFRLEPAKRRLLRGAETIELRPKAFDLLVLLVAHRDRALGKAELMSRLWPDIAVEEGNLTQCVFLVRKALGQRDGGEELIATVSRHGYRFVAPVVEVEDPTRGGSEAREAPEAQPGRGIAGRRRWGQPLTVAGIAALVAVLGVAAWALLRGSPPETGPRRTAASLQLLGAPPVDITRPGPVAISPDGRRVAVIARAIDEIESSLWLRALDDETARRIEGTAGARSPFWSPDGASLGFFADEKLQRVSVEGGPPDVVCDAPEGYGGTWSQRGVILFASRGRPIQRVPAAGGLPSPVTTLSADDKVHRWPMFLPDGERFLYGGGSTIRLGRLSGGPGRPLLTADKRAVLAAGHLVFSRAYGVRAQRFDPAAGALVGEPTTLAVSPQLDGVQSPIFSVSDSGTLVYLKGSPDDSELRWLDREGNDLGQVGRTASYFGPRLSPDGRHVAVDITTYDEYGGDVWILPAAIGSAESQATRLTHDRGNESNPIWSPDGSRVLFLSGAGQQPFDLYEASMDGLGERREVVRSASHKYPSDWSSTDDRILYMSIENGAPTNRILLWALSTAGGEPQPFLPASFGQWDARISPDGKWVAHTADQSGQWEVYVRDYPEGRTRQQVSSGGGHMPVWSRDGRELFYRASTGNRMMVVPVQEEAAARFGPARPLFTMKREVRNAAILGAQYDASPEGRFLVNMLRADPGELTLVLNAVP